MNQREFFNSMAEKWDSFCKHDNKKIIEILNLLEIKPSDKVLDVGTGTGILIPFLLERVGKGGEVCAVDISEKMIEVAMKKYAASNLTFKNEDILDCDLNTRYYDKVICYSMFPHFEDKKKAIEKLRKYLNENGKLIICHSQSREAINNLHKDSSIVVEKDILPKMEILENYFIGANYKVLKKVDSEEMFVVIAKKMD
ncbi:class I SAM-dependent methyltransferase [Peptoniphilus indolicus]|uniref:UbiE/COQ5 methyltransferase n=2 Tax=Peptoniphilus indolicus TaxID=33030 RepID=G4D1D9_9FIRM|nr:class I SAM-dependent methyltransferase [Peptoniphilus indolicus]EGY80680.1 UbiE/COQ5 methyltransferase [Peptoniphilus indolicus ATCC 29427]SUB74916.1 Glycine/sarcosine N-methyltransferase [Peptoniphilus indolicus]